MSNEKLLSMAVGERLHSRFGGTRCNQVESYFTCAIFKKVHYLISTNSGDPDKDVVLLVSLTGVPPSALSPKSTFFLSSLITNSAHLIVLVALLFFHRIQIPLS